MRSLFLSRLSLRTKAVMTIGFVPIIVIALVIYQNHQREMRDYTALLKNLANAQAQALSHSVSQAMWDINTKSIHQTLESTIKTPDIEKIIIRDENGKIVDSIWRKEWTGTHFLVSSPINFTFADEEKNLGTVEFYVTNTGTIRLFEESLRKWLFMSAGALLLQLVLSWIVLNWLLKPVQKITGTMRRLAQGETDLELPETNRSDEIGQMALAIETFRSTALRADDLEREVEIRTMLQKKLQLASARAEEANLAKSQFLATMSHEIRTPLNGIIATSDILAESDLAPRQKKLVNIIRSSGETLLGLISDVLDLAKIESGKVELHNEIANIHKAFEETGHLFVAMAQAKGLTYNYTIAPNVPLYALSDVFRLRQVMSNLISNAIKYTEIGSVSVTLDRTETNLKFTVTDSGRGIPADSLDLVFDKFTQINRKDAIGGTGLGLPICHSIIEMMDGQIGVDSEVGKGSSFWFLIPLTEISEADVLTEKALLQNRTNHTGCHVLIAEDIEVNQFVLSEMLTSLGCTVDIANNGLIASEKAATTAFDVILMDCSMPVMDGYEATRKIRDEGNTTIPIIAVTAHAMSDGVEKCLDAGMNDFISKPITKRAIQAILDKWHLVDAEKIAPQEAQTTNAVEEVVFDPSSLIDLLGAAPSARALRMLDLTLKDSDRLYSEIEDALKIQDAAALAESAHALKSVSAQVGALELSGLCKTLEMTGKSGSLAELDETVSRFKDSYATSRKFIEDIKSRYTPPES